MGKKNCGKLGMDGGVPSWNLVYMWFSHEHKAVSYVACGY